MRAGIVGIGSALPERIVTNKAFEQRLDTTDEWIVRRTGIRARHWLDGDETVAGMAVRACHTALADAGRTGAEVDHVIVSTITPDRITPGVAPELAHEIGAVGAAASDINAACAGFLYGLDQAAALIETDRAAVVLVCAAEALSRVTDHDDRSTAVLFGDGAGAAVVSGGAFTLGIGRFELSCDGDKAEILYADRHERVLRMAGQEVYRHAVARMTEATRTVLERNDRGIDDVDLFVAHQANERILLAVADELGVEHDRVVVDVGRVANTSSASIPLALSIAEQDGRLRPGALVALSAFGAGFVWGAGLITWKEQIDRAG